MGHTKSRQSGFHLIGVALAIFVVAAVGVIGFMVFQKQKDDGKSGQEVVWAYNDQENKWFAESGEALACKEPFTFDHVPIEVEQITGVLFPGAYRGYSYKPHGGFGTPEALGGKVEVKLPTDATLVGLTRYYEGSPPDLQYLLTFETDCGIAFRFDHLYTLSPELQALAEQTPEPKLNDTLTDPDDNPPRTKFKSGQVIATQVGLPSMKIYGFDFGVYDYRKPNEISKNAEWAKIHSEYESLDWFGVCWFDMMPGNNVPQTLKDLSLVQYDTRRTVPKVSDYCANAPYKTFDIEGGRPTE